VKLLLDTCAFIWLCSEPEKLGKRLPEQLNDDGCQLLLSDASLLEIAIKHRIGKFKIEGVAKKWCETQMKLWNIASLDINRDTIFQSALLPMHHRDPFDRLIMASAQLNDLPIATSDRLFQEYDVNILWD
jgi:PIN domain nuclease of toxin-antitoxin system